MKILDRLQITRKIERMAYQIAESNFDSKKIYLLGINNNGYGFAEMIKSKLENICEQKIILARISLKPKNPISEEVILDIDKQFLVDQTVIIVDDVANTGRTLFYAMKVLMDIIPSKIETAVLVDRMHKLFPISISYAGMSFATTMQDNIKVDLEKKGEETVYLV